MAMLRGDDVLDADLLQEIWEILETDCPDLLERTRNLVTQEIQDIKEKIKNLDPRSYGKLIDELGLIPCET